MFIFQHKITKYVKRQDKTKQASITTRFRYDTDVEWDKKFKISVMNMLRTLKEKETTCKIR